MTTFYIDWCLGNINSLERADHTSTLRAGHPVQRGDLQSFGSGQSQKRKEKLGAQETNLRTKLI